MHPCEPLLQKTQATMVLSPTRQTLSIKVSILPWDSFPTPRSWLIYQLTEREEAICQPYTPQSQRARGGHRHKKMSGKPLLRVSHIKGSKKLVRLEMVCWLSMMTCNEWGSARVDQKVLPCPLCIHP